MTLADSRPLLEDGFRPAARRAGRENAHLILDLQGPELRVGALEGPVPLVQGERALLGGEEGIPIPPAVREAARPGGPDRPGRQRLLLEVAEKTGEGLACRVLRGGDPPQPEEAWPSWGWRWTPPP